MYKQTGVCLCVAKAIALAHTFLSSFVFALLFGSFRLDWTHDGYTLVIYKRITAMSCSFIWVESHYTTVRTFFSETIVLKLATYYL